MQLLGVPVKMPHRKARPCIVCGPKQRPGRYKWPLVAVCGTCEVYLPPCDHHSQWSCGPDQLCPRCISKMRITIAQMEDAAAQGQ